MKNVSVILGTRPEAIKLAPIIHVLRQNGDLQYSVCSTAQHQDLLDEVLHYFGIPVERRLDTMRAGQSLGQLAARLISQLDEFLAESDPDFVVVQGDTTTTLVGALAAYYRGVPVGHVEAGLRSGNLRSPWPEEGNRLMVSRLADLHFAPTEKNRLSLLEEGVSDESILVTGNTIVDALNLVLSRAEEETRTWKRLGLGRLEDGETRMVLITCHRRENHGSPLKSVTVAVRRLAERFPETLFVWVLHPNPNVCEPIEASIGSSLPNVRLIPAQPYPVFVRLMSRSALVLSDSGGVQEEAPSLGVPVLVLRKETERSEAVSAGFVELVGTDNELVERRAAEFLSHGATRSSPTGRENPFGDGQSASRIVQGINDYLGVPGGGTAETPSR